MEIIYLDKVYSTQLFLSSLIRDNLIKKNILIYTNDQYRGIGSRGNSWVGKKGNLFFSFVLDLEDLPNDLKLESISIYISMLIKISLKDFNIDIKIKWPNDLYLDKKIGGIITQIIKKKVIIGVGLNTIKIDEFDFVKLNNHYLFLQNFIDKLSKKTNWMEIFLLYKEEFYKNNNFYVNLNNEKIFLKEAILNEDGSILINDKKVYSLR